MKNNQHKEFKNIAENYYLLLSPKDHKNAAKCYLKASEFEQALTHFINDGIGDKENLDSILNIIKQCNDDQKIIDIVLEHVKKIDNDDEDGNIDKESLFRLYLAIGDINLSTKMAMDISSQQQRMGKYQNAHRILFEIILNHIIVVKPSFSADLRFSDLAF